MSTDLVKFGLWRAEGQKNTKYLLEEESRRRPTVGEILAKADLGRFFDEEEAAAAEEKSETEEEGEEEEVD